MSSTMPQEPTLAEEVIVAPDVVLAKAGTLEITSVIKGDPALAGQRADVSGQKGAGLLILTRRDHVTGWKLSGVSSIALATFLPKIAALPSSSPSTEAEWAARLEVLRPFLGHPDPRIARSAWAIWARAPYRTLKAQSEKFQRETLRQRLAEPALESQRSLWLVMLGIRGDDEDTAWLAAQADTQWKAGDDKHLAALLTALITRRGIAAVDFIEQRYLRDHQRTLEEMQTAVAALGLHGREGTAEMRQRIIDAYRIFITERKPLAGLIAPDLAELKHWEFTPAFQAMLTSTDPLHPSARQGISTYLSSLPINPTP